MKANKDFFDEISEKCNYLDKDAVSAVYYAMLRVLGRGLREQKRIKMPNWGSFYLHRHKSRLALNVHSRKIESLGAKTEVKFEPHGKLKGYFHDFEVR